MPQDEIESTLALLISENYLNEERFALAFAGGKFRMKGWGRNKIKAELRKHRIPENILQKALNSIDGEDYINQLLRFVDKKIESIGQEGKLQMKTTLYRHLVSKGYEPDLVMQVLTKRNLNDES